MRQRGREARPGRQLGDLQRRTLPLHHRGEPPWKRRARVVKISRRNKARTSPPQAYRGHREQGSRRGQALLRARQLLLPPQRALSNDCCLLNFEARSLGFWVLVSSYRTQAFTNFHFHQLLCNPPAPVRTTHTHTQARSRNWRQPKRYSTRMFIFTNKI